MKSERRTASLPEAEPELKRHVTSLSRLPIVTGYVGKTRGGDITTRFAEGHA